VKKTFSLFIIVLLFGISFSINLSPVKAESNEQDLTHTQITLGQAEDLTVNYLKKKYGSLNNMSENLESFLEQAKPKDINSNTEYEAMRTYASTYLNRAQTTQDSSFNSSSNTTNIFTPSEKEQSIDQIQDENAQKTSAVLDGLKLASSIQPLSSFTYDKYAARDYTYKYAYSPYNSSYPHFTDDCTNFMSQAVHAGGYAMHPEWTMSKSGSDFHYTRSWTVVYDFFNYWGSTRGHSYRVFKGHDGIADYANIGDIIIFYDQTDKNRTWYHAVMDTHEANGEVYYSAHTHDPVDYPLSAVNGYENDFFVLKF
jgi:hypothetical protein